MNVNEAMDDIDHTPESWSLFRRHSEPKIKKYLRKILYPWYLRILNIFFSEERYSFNFPVDQWYWGHRGFDYHSNRKILEQYTKIKGKILLIPGCGLGEDIPTWAEYSPKEIIGIDYFNYERAWGQIRTYYKSIKFQFIQNDVSRVTELPDNSVDIVGSDAVFEHLQDFPAALAEFHRVLKPGGILFAGFGPLWYCYGGDHISGNDKLDNGYMHLLADKTQYYEYLNSFGDFIHSEDDGRVWIKSGLFSYLRAEEYISALEFAGFKKLFHGVIISPEAIHCLKQNPRLKQKIFEKHKNLKEHDLLVAGMLTIYQK